LEVLNLQKNEITASGAHALGSWLKVYPKLMVLNVAENPQLGAEGACYIADAATQLHALAIGANNITDQGYRSLGKLLMRSSCLCELDLGGNNNPSVRTLEI
jgi:Ran GTPase-activating protein (RanGAP) involved in mRNA processing and transport